MRIVPFGYIVDELKAYIERLHVDRDGVKEALVSLDGSLDDPGRSVSDTLLRHGPALLSYLAVAGYFLGYVFQRRYFAAVLPGQSIPFPLAETMAATLTNILVVPLALLPLSWQLAVGARMFPLAVVEAARDAYDGTRRTAADVAAFERDAERWTRELRQAQAAACKDDMVAGMAESLCAQISDVRQLAHDSVETARRTYRLVPLQVRWYFRLDTAPRWSREALRVGAMAVVIGTTAALLLFGGPTGPIAGDWVLAAPLLTAAWGAGLVAFTLSFASPSEYRSRVGRLGLSFGMAIAATMVLVYVSALAVSAAGRDLSSSTRFPIATVETRSGTTTRGRVVTVPGSPDVYLLTHANGKAVSATRIPADAVSSVVASSAQ